MFFEWKYHTSGFLGRETHEKTTTSEWGAGFRQKKVSGGLKKKICGHNR
jgi:hypothetical protein